MKLKPARRKKHCKLSKNKPFPISNNVENNIIYTGRFNGFCVIINNSEDMSIIHSKGFFGKGNLSRSFPNFNTPTKQSVVQNEHNSKEMSTVNAKETYIETEINLNDSALKTKDTKLLLTHSLSETLNLSLEEAFFLSKTLKCLNIYDFNNKLLEHNIVWKLFAISQPNFIQSYIAYHYFRARKWVVKSGLKFGGDFLLYKQGPPFFHASYLVIINVIFSDKYEENININQKSVGWINLIGLNRLTETAAKELIICQIIWPAQVSKEEAINSSDIIKLFSVNTILLRRWIAKQERNLKIENKIY